MALTALITLSSYAADTDAIAAAVQAKHSANETFSCAFTEVKTMPKLKKEEKQEGTLTYTAPEYLRMDYTEPKGDYMLISATEYLLVKKGMKQNFSKSPRMLSLKQMLLQSFAGKVSEIIQQNEAAAECKEDGNNYVFELTPAKGKAQGLKQLTLKYDKKSGQLTSLTMTEMNGNYTTYTVK